MLYWKSKFPPDLYTTRLVRYSLCGWITSFAKAEQHLRGIELASLILPDTKV